MWYDYMTGNIWSDQENDFNHGGAGQSPSPTGSFIFLLFLWFLEIMILFEKKESEALGETTMLQTRMHPSQQKFINLLGTRKSHTPSICIQSVFIDRDLRGPFALEIFSYWKSSREF